ncbi:laccase [Podochytrium sp. JEL0797]|nr:laccase [Podochytrium sp. JEL0797]
MRCCSVFFLLAVASASISTSTTAIAKNSATTPLPIPYSATTTTTETRHAIFGHNMELATRQSFTSPTSKVSLQTKHKASPTKTACAATPTKTFTLNLTQKVLNLDGVPKLMMVANNVLDYAIHVNKGDFVVVTVNNHMNVSSSLHWHGLFQEETPWMDGPAMVTQCPIPKGKSLTYRFSTGNQAGTFWWHAHYASQYVDGMRGPFIVHDPKDPYAKEYDEEIIVTLSDHHHKSALTVLSEYLYAFDPVPESGLINGAGRFNCSATSLKCTPDHPLANITVSKGKRYRLRIINMSAEAAFTFSIDGHNMTRKFCKDSVILHATAPIDNYWIRATIMDMYTPTGTEITNGVNFNVTAVLRYNGAKSGDPLAVSWNPKMPLNVYTLGELNGLTASTLPNYDVYIYFSFTIIYDPITNMSISTVTVLSDETNFLGSQYLIPKVPTLQSMLLNHTLPSSLNVVPVKNGWTFLQIRNTDNIEHTFHLHGHAFYVIGVGKLLHRDSSSTLSTYPRRDAVQVPKCSGGQGGTGETGCVPGYVDILINFDHPGAWIFHCHIEWHMMTGLVLTFANYDGIASVEKKIPKDWRDAPPTASTPSTKHFTLNLSQRILAPDGVPKLMMIANNVLDYAIHVNKGDFVSIQVNNGMNESTSIHWHGLFQEDTPWMDGPGMVTQCLIPSGSSKTYNFTVANQTGTYWWHAHYASQYTDGLRGPFIIHDPQDPYAGIYDEEIVVTLADNFHRGADEVLRTYYNAFDPVPDSGLINSIGQFNCSFATGVCITPNDPHKIYNVVQGKRYRLRIINMSAHAAFQVSLDGHNMTVIESDGVYTNPTVVNNLPISTSQRYSVIINATQPVGNFWFRALIMDMYTPTGSVIDTDPRVDIPTNTTETVSTVTIHSDSTNFYASQYLMPSQPTLQTVLEGNIAMIPSSSNIVVASGWAMIQIRNSDNVEHTFHLHGHTFYVLRTGKLLHRDTTTSTYPRRDAIQVPQCSGGVGGTGEAGCTMGYVNILVNFNHPGVWLFHCHVDWHMATGLAMTFVNLDGIESVQERIPHDWFDSCAANVAATTTALGGNAGMQATDTLSQTTESVMQATGSAVQTDVVSQIMSSVVPMTDSITETTDSVTQTTDSATQTDAMSQVITSGLHMTDSMKDSTIPISGRELTDFVSNTPEKTADWSATETQGTSETIPIATEIHF